MMKMSSPSRLGAMGCLTRHMSSSPRHFPKIVRLSSRWNDNDVFGHINNAVYYSYIDTAVNNHLIENGITGKRFLAQRSASCD
jgi:acyl-CoA thioesterase FadM